MRGYQVFREWMLEHTELYVDMLYHNSIISIFVYV